ncbi:MAG: hypothetical protein ACLSCE_07800 [Bacteroides cellulosilyticus]
MKTSINLKNMRVLLSMLFVFLSVNAVAQNITGTVKDSQGRAHNRGFRSRKRDK